jgi:hypothetical protein
MFIALAVYFFNFNQTAQEEAFLLSSNEAELQCHDTLEHSFKIVMWMHFAIATLLICNRLNDNAD